MKFQYRLSPLLSRVRSRLGLTNDYRRTSDRSWEIAPAAVSLSPPGIFDEGDLRKISGVYPGNTLEQRLERVRGREVRRGPTVVHEFHNAVLAHGHLFTHRMSLAIGTSKAPLFAQTVPEVTDGVLASSSLGTRFFGHWMHDDMPLMLAVQELGEPISVQSDLSPLLRGHLEVIDLRPKVMTSGCFRRILVVDDNSLNTYRCDRYLRLRGRAARRARPSKAPGVMLLRGNSGSPRRLLNEDEVAEVARRRGFVVLNPLRASVAELLDACSGVPIVLGVEGSHLSNSVIWMAAEGTLVLVQPPQRFTTALKNWCDILGTRYAFTVADPREDDSFHVKIDTLERLLDRVGQRPH